jgi:hypothetical protein
MPKLSRIWWLARPTAALSAKFRVKNRNRSRTMPHEYLLAFALRVARGPTPVVVT